MPHALMLFAAGFGTRMGALTENLPKPLIKVAGIPLIDHALNIVAAAGVKTTVVNTHYLPDMIAGHLSEHDITLSYEDKILETGGGLRNALPLLGNGPVFTFNPDAIWTGDNPLSALAKAWNPDKMDGLLLLIPKAQALGHKGAGDFNSDTNGRIMRGTDLVYSGAQIIKTDGLFMIKQDRFSLNLLWDDMIENRRAYGVTHAANWCDVGNPKGILVAEKMLKDADV